MVNQLLTLQRVSSTHLILSLEYRNILDRINHFSEVRKVMKLASTYTDLKNTGRLDTYLNKKRKRLASKKRKNMPTRRVQDE